MKVLITNQASMNGQYDGAALDLQTTIAETEIVEGLSATKTASKALWSGGTMTYTVVVTNDTDFPFETPSFTDQLDARLNLVANSVNVDGTARTYTFAGNLLTVALDTIPANGSTTITFDVSMV